ncbi:MAG: hypothetical protein ABI655_10420 [Phenylobacterium sp.]
MPAFQTVLGEFNVHMGQDKLGALAQRAPQFAQGNALDLNFLVDEKTPLSRAWKSYLAQVPPAIQEALRAVIHAALTSTPPTQITFAWAPAYDYEMTIWQAPDTKMTKGGITVLFKSRYPDDKHPLKS